MELFECADLESSRAADQDQDQFEETWSQPFSRNEVEKITREVLLSKIARDIAAGLSDEFGSNKIGSVGFARAREQQLPPLRNDDSELEAGWTPTHDDIRDRVSTVSTMGLVSALTSGFVYSALIEVDLPETSPEVAALFLLSSSGTLGFSLIVVIQTTLEFMFVMRELARYGPVSAWQLEKRLGWARRVTEACFVCAIPCFFLASACIVLARFLPTHPTVAVVVFVVFTLLIFLTLLLMADMQRHKKSHQTVPHHPLKDPAHPLHATLCRGDDASSSRRERSSLKSFRVAMPRQPSSAASLSTAKSQL